MNNITAITQGLDFTVRIQARRIGYNRYVKVSFEEITNITVNLINLPSEKTPLAYTIDSMGRLIIPVSGETLVCNTYGLEITGFYNNGNWRHQIMPLVEIVNNSTEDNYALNETDDRTIDFNITIGETYVSSRVFAKTVDDISNSLAEKGATIDQINNDLAEKGAAIEQLEEEIGEAGKVDDVKVNGSSVVTNKEANITIPTKTSDLQNDSNFPSRSEIPTKTSDLQNDSDFVNENDMQSALDEKQDKIDTVNLDYQEDGGSPSASASFENGELDISMKNMKIKFSELTAEEKESLRGPQGIPGEGAIWTGQGEEIMTLAQETGQAINKGMSQKAVTDEMIFEYERLDVSSYPIQNCYVSSGQWATGNSSKNTRWIPVTPGQIFKFEDKGYYTNGYCAIFLETNSWTAGQTLSNKTPANWAHSTKIVQVPEGYNYLMLSHIQGGYDAEPRVYTPVTIKEKLANDTLLLSEQQLDKPERKQAQSNIGMSVYDNNTQLVPKKIVISDGGNTMLRTYLPDNYLDLEVYEGKSYRDIFETEALYHQDFEGTAPTLVGSATIVTSQHDTGTKSMKCNASNAFLKVVNVMRNNKVIPMYVAFRANVPSYTAGSVCNFWTGTKSTIKCEKNTNGWESFTGIEDVGKFGSDTYLDIYFGTFSSWTSGNDAYIDNISFVPLTIFSKPPTKAQLDAWYEDYIAIKQGVYTPSIDYIDIPLVSKHIIRLSEPNYGFTNDECIEEFMAAMNAKAEEIGMSSSSFSNPYGGNRWGYNWITTEDAIKMVIHSCAYKQVINHLSQKTPAKFRIVNSKTPSRTGDYYYPLVNSQSFTPIMTRLQNAYNYLHSNGDIPYQVLSIKGAGWGDLPDDNSDSKVIGYVGTALIQGKQVAFACYAAKTAYDLTPPSGQTLRALGTIQLLDICNTALSGGDITGMAVTYCNCAMVAEIPNATPNAFKNNYGITPIYSLNATEVINPASSTKVLAAMVMMDVDTNIYDCVEIVAYDEAYDTSEHEWSPNDSGDFEQHDGDRQNVDALLWGSLGYSNGVSTIALARYFGGKMLYAKSKVGL